MKFNWGTGIFLFLTMFILAAIAFTIFAMRQNVNLVHEDYYQKGVNHTEKMNTDARSVAYYNDLKTSLDNDYLRVELESAADFEIDSGRVQLYRPSDSNRDVNFKFDHLDKGLAIPKKELISGRYILKIYWYSKGLEYEIEKPVNIQ
jgi:nitrogen fixation protein FixH